MSDWVWRQGDTASAIVETLKDASGNAIDLQNVPGNPTLTVTPLRGGTAIISAQAMTKLQNGTGVDGTKGMVQYQPQAGDSAVAGDYLMAIKATFTGGSAQTFPNGGYLLLTITPTAPVSSAGAYRYVQKEEFKQTANLQGQVYADSDIEIALGAASDALELAYDSVWTKTAGGVIRYYTAIDDREATLGDVLGSVTEIAIDLGYSGQYDTILATTDYRLLPVINGLAGAGGNGQPFRYLRLARGKQLQGLPQLADGIRVTAQYGWESVPAGAKAAVTVLAARLLRRTREAPFGIIGVGTEGLAVRAAQIARDPEIVFLMDGLASPRGQLV